MDEQFFRRALALARTGRGVTEPNPSVGCVLVRDGRVIGEGRSQAAGGRHAEPMAIADAAARNEPTPGATAYVTLEPCCHTSKRTPPCVPAVIAAGIRRVVVGCLDPNPSVNGDGVRQLQAAGIEVTRVPPELEAEAKQQIAPFTARTLLSRPYITVKWAVTADGYIAGPGGARRQISSEPSMRVVHQLRARCEAIAVGGETVRRDDPLLTVRGLDVERQPLRVIFTESGNLPPTAKLLAPPDPAAGAPAETLVWRRGLAEGIRELAQRGVSHLLVESGGRLAAALAREGLVDRAWVFRSPHPLGQPGIEAIQWDWPITAQAHAGEDAITEMLNPASPVFFAPTPSPDFEHLLPK